MSKSFMAIPIRIVIIIAIFGIPALSQASGIISGISGQDYYSDKFIISIKEGVELYPAVLQNGQFQSLGNRSIEQISLAAGVIEIKPFYDARIRNEYMRSVVERIFILKLTDNANLETAIGVFSNSSEVEYAEPYYICHADYTPNDPLSFNWYHLRNIEAYFAWDVIRGDSTRSPILAIVDSGVYWDHPDLEPNMWINAGEDIDGDGRFTEADINGIDDDGNDFVDDVVGYDISMQDNNPFEPIPWHGTHVAGCASMTTDNGYGGAAVGWAARIMAVKCARDNDPNSIPNGFQGIIYATDNGAKVINCSWGRPGSPSQSEQSIITSAYNAGVTVICAAGNESSSARHYPAAYEHVISVASVGSDDTKSSFSNFGSWVDISAPGDGIISTWDHSLFTSLSGTSMASPIVSGTACLILAANPSYTPDEVEQRLGDTADDIDSLNPDYIGLLGHGRVNAAAAVGMGVAPRIEVVGVGVILTNDLDNDGMPNPGETINVVIDLSNAYADANNVTGMLVSDGQFTLNDSIADFGSIPGNGGMGNNSSNPFSVTINDDATIGQHVFTLYINSGSNYRIQRPISLMVTLQQRGFPANILGQIESSPLVFDVDGDQSNEIIVSANDRKYYVYESDGSLKAGWPVNVASETPGGPSVGDLDNDGQIEIVGTDRSGNIYAWDSEGNFVDGFPFAGSSIMYSSPVLGDINGDSYLEIVACGFTSKKVYILNHDGTAFPNWPYQGIGNFYGSPALADIDNDGLPEIIACDFDSTIHVWNQDKTYVEGFPKKASGQFWVNPSVVDIDGDGNLNIIAATSAGDLYVYDNNGSVMPGWPVRFSPGPLRSSPSLADIDGDGHIEILIGSNDGNMYVYNSDGTPQSCFPFIADGNVSSSPVVGKIDGDNIYDIVIGSSEGLIYAFNVHGRILNHFPIRATSDRIDYWVGGTGRSRW